MKQIVNMPDGSKIACLLLFLYCMFKILSKDFVAFYDFLKSLDAVWLIIGFLLGFFTVYLSHRFEKAARK
jgi:hypothetical protein